ncbi:AMP-dependent synthetase/ligase [Trema orientale]|uniref:AMP-dependent synthetase/ligase n=1 Tax=Trema orientale TaxID=63057 RepID=A0A2P5EB00_TREOI|nr:AMP-dependent synthetase/ligase [Trema orientale]
MIMKGVMQCPANNITLSPVSFLERAALVYGDNTSIVDCGNPLIRFSWKQTYQRCLNLASALLHLGISRHDVVSSLFDTLITTYKYYSFVVVL